MGGAGGGELLETSEVVPSQSSYGKWVIDLCPLPSPSQCLSISVFLSLSLSFSVCLSVCLSVCRSLARCLSFSLPYMYHKYSIFTMRRLALILWFVVFIPAKVLLTRVFLMLQVCRNMTSQQSSLSVSVCLSPFACLSVCVSLSLCLSASLFLSFSLSLS